MMMMMIMMTTTMMMMMMIKIVIVSFWSKYGGECSTELSRIEVLDLQRNYSTAEHNNQIQNQWDFPMSLLMIWIFMHKRP